MLFACVGACVGRAFTKYRILVFKEASAEQWCIQQFSFYDKSGKRIQTRPSGYRYQAGTDLTSALALTVALALIVA